MKARMILNPKAGAGDHGDWLIERGRALAGGELDVVRTNTAEEVGPLAAETARAGFDRLIVAGGDGTVSQAVNGLAADFEACQLAVVPSGTANDFARTMGLPGEPGAALEVALRGRSVRVDLVRCVLDDGPARYLINAATGGFSRAEGTEGEASDQAYKGMWGSLAYLRSAMERVGDIPEYEMELRFDDERPTRLRGPALIVANGRYAGGMSLVPSADPNSHWLEVVAVTAGDLQSRLELLGQFIVGRHLEAEEGLVHRRSGELAVAAQPRLHFSMDGEPIGRTPLRFQIVPEALRLVMP